MFILTVVALSLSLPLPGVDPPDLVPGDGVALDSVPPVVSPVELPQSDDDDSPLSFPFGFGTIAGMGLLGTVAVSKRSKRKQSMDPVYVLVHGHGGSASDFDVLLGALGVDSSDTVAFDWRDAEPLATSTEASRVASTANAAAELDQLIRELAADHGNIYSLHHSKGGAAGVSMIAALDDGTRPPIDGYRGAALLDPAISGGLIGGLQRFGGWTSYIPDNGGFDPISCTDDGCRDTREHLGDASGVEVVVIRNPDAVFTNFWDEPEGLRVYDLADDGKPSALAFWAVPPMVVTRTYEAHGSVLDHWAVVDCIEAEVARPGSCEWKGDGG